MNELTSVLQNDKAIKLHREIITNGNLAAVALVEFCKGLKQMRDEKLYIELGFETFDNYVETAVGIKSRQAYTYISSYEKLGPTMMAENANLGITKLELLATVPNIERVAFVEENNLKELSTRKIKELTEKYKQACEQISMLKDEVFDYKQQTERTQKSDVDIEKIKEMLAQAEKQKQDADAQLKAEIDKRTAIENELKAIKAKPVEVAVSAPSKEDIDKIRQQEQKKAEKLFNEKLTKADNQKKELIERAEKLEQQLKLAGDSATQKTAIYFSELQSVMQKLTSSVSETNNETKEKLTSAIKKYLQQQIENL